MILIMGPSGAGKSSQAQILERSNNKFKHLEIGATLRQSQNSPAYVLMGQGRLVDDDIVATIIKAALAQIPATQEPVLDGFPRRLSQADFLEETLKELDQTIRTVIVLDVAQEVILERLSKRGRHDDLEATIKRKWQIYQSETQQVIEHYAKRGLVRRVDGEAAIATVAQLIQKALGDES